MLKKHTITIPLGLGINTKTDEKLVEQGAFNLVCENASFGKVGAVQKRPAYEDLSTTYYEPGNLVGTGTGDYTELANTPKCVAGLNGSVFLKNKLGEYFYSHKDGFVYKKDYPIPECKVTTLNIYSSPSAVINCDTDYDSSEGIVLASVKNQAITGFLGSSRLIIYDNTKKSSIECYTGDSNGVGDIGLSRASFTRVAGESYYYHIYQNSDNKTYVEIFNKYGQPHAAAFNYPDAPIPNSSIAICRSQDESIIYLMIPTTTLNSARFIAISGTTELINTTFSYIGTGWASATAMLNTSTGKIHLAYATTGGVVRGVIFDNTGAVFTADYVMTGAPTSTSISYQNETGYLLVNESNRTAIYYPGLLSSGVENYNTQYVSSMVSLDSGPVVLAIDGLDQKTYFGMSRASNIAGTKVFARLAPGNGYEITGQMPRMAKIGTNMAVIAHPRLALDNGTYQTYNLALTFFDMSQDYASGSREILGKNLHFAGGFLTEFDGETLMENGFHLRCPDPIVSSAAAGSLTGTYSYRVILRYTDKNGQLTRSEPSGIVSTGAVTSKRIAIDLKAVPFGIKPLSCVAEIYRTTNGGTVFYYVTEQDANHYNGEYAWNTGTLTDNVADSFISDNTMLYTTGSVLANNPGPACRAVVQGGNRLALLGLEDENEIGFSQKKKFGESVNFSDFFRIRIDSSQYSTSGGVVAGGYMDDKLIILKKSSIFYIAGDGPLETGFDNTFTEPELVTSEAGCTDPRSVVLTPLGLMFKGEKGIYLLTRGLETNYIGSGIEEFNHLNVSSAVHVDNKNQVIFTLIGESVSDKVIAVYDYFTNQWSITKGVRAIDGDLLNGRHLLLNGDNSTPQVQAQGSYLENALAYSMKTKTPWIKLTGIQDFARIWTATILGKFKSAHKLIIKVYYDYDSSTFETYERTPSVTDKQYQYQIHLKKQKCEAIQFEIYDSEQSGTGESMELTALTLEVGVKKGSFKLSADRRI